jgi:mono/diheme cytochrome c family protein
MPMSAQTAKWIRWALTIVAGTVVALVLVVTVWYWVKKSRTYPESTISPERGEVVFRTALFDNYEAEGVPYWIWKTLPEMFPDLFAAGYAGTGFVWEPGADLPVGMNKSPREGLEWVTHNCALCHAGAYRLADDGPETIVMGMPNVTFQRQVYVEALDRAYTSEQFTSERVLAIIDKHTALGAPERAAIGEWTGKLRERSLLYKSKVGTTRDWHPRITPGAAEGFGAAKQYAGVFDTTLGTADFPSTFMQGKRVIGHWDGISTSTLERVIGSALAIGAVGDTIDMQQMLDIDHYTKNLAPPAYPQPIDKKLATRGQEVFTAACATCHADGGARINTVVPLSEIETDPHRQQSLYFSFLWRIKLGTLPGPYPFQHWQTSDGYRSDYLEGIWLRGPYLHNGSVPTLRDLLKPVTERPAKFYRGANVLDVANVGFKSDAATKGNNFLYDTSLPGYANTGHEYGIGLPDADKAALLEYLKTL